MWDSFRRTTSYSSDSAGTISSRPIVWRRMTYSCSSTMESPFDVLVFNYANLCEKEASYFQRKSDRELVEEDEQLGPIKKHRRTRKETLFCKPVFKGMTPKDVTMVSINWITDDEVQLVIRKKSPSSYLTYKSNRRPVTEEEVSLALDLAKDAVTSDGFLSVHVEWGRKHLENQNQDIILRVEEETWNAKYSVTGRETGRLSTGWKAFSLDNNLEEFDVCVFDLAESIYNTVVLDVNIFCVLEEAVH